MSQHPTMHIVMTFGGSSIIDQASLDTGDNSDILAILRPVFAPRLTNDVEIVVLHRKPGMTFDSPEAILKVCTANFKADTVSLKREGTGIKVFAGTHDPDKSKVDANGKRPNYEEVDFIPNVFPA